MRPRIAVASVTAAVLAAAAAVLLVGGGDEPRAFHAPATASSLAAEVRKAVPPALKAGHVPGAAVAIVRRDRVVWAGGFGIADARTRRPVTVDTVFQAGSLSKPVTAWGAVRGVLPLLPLLRRRLHPAPVRDRAAHRRAVRRLGAIRDPPPAPHDVE